MSCTSGPQMRLLSLVILRSLFNNPEGSGKMEECLLHGSCIFPGVTPVCVSPTTGYGSDGRTSKGNHHQLLPRQCPPLGRWGAELHPPSDHRAGSRLFGQVPPGPHHVTILSWAAAQVRQVAPGGKSKVPFTWLASDLFCLPFGKIFSYETICL